MKINPRIRGTWSLPHRVLTLGEARNQNEAGSKQKMFVPNLNSLEKLSNHLHSFLKA
jgi:hypothetical protein